ncbi:MAG: GyrI-like domain-containing protein [Anaerolineales bacterium]
MKILVLKKELKYLYAPSAKKVEMIQVPRLHFAMIDGAIEKGSEPGKSPAFAEATEALYGISYTLKFMFKKRKTKAVDYPVMALEGLWWVEDGMFDIAIKDNWFYTLMILQPDIITQDIFEEGLAQVRRKRGESEALSKLRLESFEEGWCAQVMHIGPYATEPASVGRMKAFAAENGYRDRVSLGAKHHEIYMGDPRRAQPEKLKTILRHPIEKEK